MNNFSKIVILIIIVLSVLFVKDNFGDNIGNFINKHTPFEVQRKNPFGTQKEVKKPEVKKAEKSENKSKIEKDIKIYYLTLDKNSNPIYKPILRANLGKESRLEYSIRELLKGPDLLEKSKGTYSEIPSATKLLSITETEKTAIINLSDDFELGGGTDSIYSRLMQIIKTSLANAQGRKVYLHINGKQADFVGGEGIMVTQPLKENSLGE
ncbi:GerMN domain-containing protein [bacterium]|nr:GerMN domain-containing protein [bacterium]